MPQIISQDTRKILIVDDDIIQPQLISASTLMKEYEISSCISGQEALTLSKQNPPDLFLLDYMMPEMTGPELCQKLKKDPDLKDIPVIFITALHDTQEVVAAYQSGAVDYVNKPIRMEELAVRVKTHIDLYLAKQDLQKYANHMEDLAQQRAKQLVHADRLVALGTLSAGLAHEIKNPTTFISGNIQTLERFWPVIKEQLDKEPSSQVNFVLDEMPNLLGGMKDGVFRILKIVDSLKTFSRKDKVTMRSVDFEKIFENVMLLCQKVVKERIEVVKDISSGLMIWCDSQQIEQVLINLIINASHSMEKSENAKLNISARRIGSDVVIKLEDNGSGVPEKIIQNIWDPFFTTKPVGKGTGLGLSISRSIIEAHSGKIDVANKPEGGAVFQIVLPYRVKE